MLAARAGWGGLGSAFKRPAASGNNVVMPDDLGGAGRRGSGPGLSDRVELLADADRPASWVLLAGGVLQSHVDLGNPRHLEIEYVRRIGHLIDAAAPPGWPLRALHLGAGGLTLARYVAETRPGSAQLAVEYDPRVVGLVRNRLPLGEPGPQEYPGSPPGHPGSPRPSARRPGTGGPGAGHGWLGAGIRVRLGDARAVLEQVPAASFDVLVADVFAGGTTPAHVTSVEFTDAVARALAPSGIYAANIGDGPAGDGEPLAHTRGRVAAARAVFAHTCLIAEPGVLRGRRFGNLVLAAADHEFPVASLTRRLAADPCPARLLEGAELDRFVGECPPITDASAQPSPTPPPRAFI